MLRRTGTRRLPGRWYPLRMTNPEPTADAGTAPYERLTAWQACHKLALAVHQASARWPREELFGLTAEARRAVLLATSSIVLGQNRSTPEFQAALDAALGALGELRYVLHLSRDLGHTPSEQWGELEALRDHAARLTWGLMAAIGKGAKRPKKAKANGSRAAVGAGT